MSLFDSIRQQIGEYEKELDTYSDRLNHAQINNAYADIERYAHMIEFTHRKIANAELRLHDLKITG